MFFDNLNLLICAYAFVMVITIAVCTIWYIMIHSANVFLIVSMNCCHFQVVLQTANSTKCKCFFCRCLLLLLLLLLLLHIFQVKQDYIQSNLTNIDQETAILLCCLGIRHYYKDTNQSSDKKHHIDYIEKEIGFSNFIPKFVIDTIKQKNLKKLIQTGYKKVYNYSEMEYMLKFFEMLRTQYVYDQEQFIVTLGSGWNIPVDLIIGPHVGISYITHPQANPMRVTDFENIEKITTSVLQSQHALNSMDGGGGSSANKTSEKGDTSQCTCSEIKTLLKIKVKGMINDDLAITCKGVKAAESIADLVDGYCRIVNNSNLTFWERFRSSSHNYTDSLEKNGHLSLAQKELSRSAELQLQQQLSGKHQGPNSLYDASNMDSCKFSFNGKFHSFHL